MLICSRKEFPNIRILFIQVFKRSLGHIYCAKIRVEVSISLEGITAN